MVLNAVNAGPACCKPLAADVSMCTSMGGRRGFNVSETSSTRTSPMPFSGASKGSEFLITKVGQRDRVVIDPGKRDVSIPSTH